ncbi:tRNA (adenosine(37)-N6)-dimethylallyltransferase MiaA, partial [bacterium]|nr:tRNA (adenosine(37)-N6)-dimethylallyltransferase MiaA [bacterium]
TLLNNKTKVIAIVGPTASGKTSYSIELAKKIDGEIISADSRLVYKYMNIGTAKPTIDEMGGIPHYMIDIIEPTDDYSAGLFKIQASQYIKKITSKGKIPIIVGGTGLYVDTLLRGYNMPQIPPDKQYRQYLEQFDNDELHKKLVKLDSDSTKKIEKNDRKKIIRALEIIKYTNEKLDNVRDLSDSEYEIEWIGRNFSREELYLRINKRVDKMINNGLVEETKWLLNKYGKAYNIVNTIGYREIFKYLDNNLSLEEATELLKKNTRNYAKRQLTWFRKFDDIKWNVFPEKLKK